MILFAIVTMQITMVFAGNGNDDKSNTNNTQTSQITGKIVDFSNNEGLVGVAVKILETGQVVYTDFDGNFSIKNVPAGQKVQLQVNYISYQTVIINDLKAAFPISAIKVSLSKVQ